MERPSKASNLPNWPAGLREDLAAQYVGLSVTTFRGQVAAKIAPPPLPMTKGRQVWLIDDLRDYLLRRADQAPGRREWLKAQGLDGDRGGGTQYEIERAEWDRAFGGTGGSSLS